MLLLIKSIFTVPTATTLVKRVNATWASLSMRSIEGKLASIDIVLSRSSGEFNKFWDLPRNELGKVFACSLLLSSGWNVCRTFNSSNFALFLLLLLLKWHQNAIIRGIFCSVLFLLTQRIVCQNWRTSEYPCMVSWHQATPMTTFCWVNSRLFLAKLEF